MIDNLEGELVRESTVANFATVQTEGDRKPFMGLISFSGELPALKDIKIAKNYLKEDELRILNNLVSGYFDLVEISGIEHRPMYTSDYVAQLFSILISGNSVLACRRRVF